MRINFSSLLQKNYPGFARASQSINLNVCVTVKNRCILVIKNDAVHIYSKYISEDASCSIDITDQLRKVVLGKLLILE